MSSTEPSFLRDLQFRLEYVALRTVAGFVRLLPLEVATAISASAWARLAPIVNPRRQARALENLLIAFPEKTDGERRAICAAHWRNLGRV
ncbi:MAG: hypothetical protein ABIU95_05525, partial [Burkholderiales bacterium]